MAMRASSTAMSKRATRPMAMEATSNTDRRALLGGIAPSEVDSGSVPEVDSGSVLVVVVSDSVPVVVSGSVVVCGLFEDEVSAFVAVASVLG